MYAMIYGLLMRCMSFIGKYAMLSLEIKTKDPRKVQEKLLLSILKKNKDTEYGRKYGFSEIHSIDEYQKKLPVCEYGDFVPYIMRMVKGERNVLVKARIPHFNRTSATLGPAKYIPLISKQIRVFGKYFALQSNATISAQIGYGWNDGKGISLVEGAAEVLPSGATYGCAESVSIRKGPLRFLYSKIYTSPIEARQPDSGINTCYMHARFALAERNATYMTASFSSNIMEFFTYIRHNWEMLVRDIENGAIDEREDLPGPIRASLLKKIRPDPKRAGELREAFAAGFETPWARRVWKKLRYIYCSAGGNFAPYTEKLKRRVLGEDVHVFYLGITASEGFFSTVWKMDEEPTVMAPDGCFMEFMDADGEDGAFLTMDQLKPGRSYELVITNFSGLYRYRMHDVIRVTGFHNKTPLAVFKNRVGFAANLRGEKTSEAAVRSAVRETEKELGLNVVDFSIWPDDNADKPMYVMFLELSDRPEGLENEQIRACLQRQLILSNPELEDEFSNGYLAPLKLITLQPGTYTRYRNAMIAQGASSEQLKPLNIVRNEFQREFLFGSDERNGKIRKPDEKPESDGV